VGDEEERNDERLTWVESIQLVFQPTFISTVCVCGSFISFSFQLQSKSKFISKTVMMKKERLKGSKAASVYFFSVHPLPKPKKEMNLKFYVTQIKPSLPER
jgi:hypothetical protein